jgi:hypothetical protein
LKTLKEKLGKTVLLMTNQIHFLNKADHIIVLENLSGDDDEDKGKKNDSHSSIVFQGTYEEFVASGNDIEKYIVKKKEDDKEDFECSIKSDEVDNSLSINSSLLENRKSTGNSDSVELSSTPSSMLDNIEKNSVSESNKNDVVITAGKKLMTKEEQETGSISFKVFFFIWSYLTIFSFYFD